jgi:electron transfer flavoprotein alpha subunit
MFPASRQSLLRQARCCLRPTSRPIAATSLSSLARLLSTLVLLEQREGKLSPAALNAVTAAAKLGGSITGFVAGGGVKAAAEEAAKIKGLEKILAVENDAYSKVWSGPCTNRGCSN